MTTSTTHLLTTFITSELLKGRTITLAPSDDLLLSGLVDSLGILRLIGYIEDQLGIEVPPQHVTIEHFGSVEAIVDYLHMQQSA